MNIYLAARYLRREELLTYRAELEAMGHRVTSRWLNGGHEGGGGPVGDVGAEASLDARMRFAREDWQDVMEAHCVISFTEPSGEGPARGGRHVEYGMALGRGKRCLVVGHRETVFHCLPGVEYFPTWGEAKLGLVQSAGGIGLTEGDELVLDGILAQVRAEVVRARRKHRPMNSPHEGYAVILEEVDELWDEVKQDTGREQPALIEAVQVAAMGVRYAMDMPRS